VAWLAIAVFAVTIITVISNVVVILMMAPVALPLARALKLPVTPLVLLLELLGDRVEAPDFEKILGELDWRAIFFYIALFALFGGLERMHILDALAQQLRPIFTQRR
jgi:Na+/H+ antiporter NhaD/arsenite permease-like protein